MANGRNVSAEIGAGLLAPAPSIPITFEQSDPDWQSPKGRCETRHNAHTERHSSTYQPDHRTAHLECSPRFRCGTRARPRAGRAQPVRAQ
jgi:hypothetical protein